MKKFAWNVYAAIIVSNLFWGISYIWSKIVFTVYPPITTIMLRLAISSIFLTLFGMAFKRLQPVHKQDVKHLFLLAFFQPFLYFLGENLGLFHVSATVAAIMIATYPLFTPLAAYWFFKQRISFMNFVGIGLSVSGVILVILKPDFTFSVSLLGILFLTVAVASSVAYSVVVVKLSNRYSAFSLITYQNIIGVLLFVPMALLVEPNALTTARINLKAMAALAQLAILASSVAYLLFIYGIQQIGVPRATAFANTIPVFTAISAYLILGERLFFINIVGITIVICGLLLAQMRFQQFGRGTS